MPQVRSVYDSTRREEASLEATHSAAQILTGKKENSTATMASYSERNNSVALRAVRGCKGGHQNKGFAVDPVAHGLGNP